MPTRFLDGETPIVQFDPRLEVSPFSVFRRLREGRPPRLLDVRPEPGERTLAGAEPWPGPAWRPAADEEVVLFDQDGTLALPITEALHAQGCERVRALFGGLDLWEFSLDPQVVGEETYLVRR